MTGSPNWAAIAIFAGFVGLTLVITGWAARRTKTRADFYAAGGSVSGFRNGLAIAGDYMSAASFLGISSQIFGVGYDGLIYSIGFLVGWPLILFLMAERLRNLGKYTFADVASFRFAQAPVRSFAALSTLAVVLFYLIAQMVGAGQLIKTLFGLEYIYAVIIVGVLMTLYVLLGGMIATTWVQVIKAVLLLGCATIMALAVLIQFGFSPGALFARAVEVKTQIAAATGLSPEAAHAKGLEIMGPGKFLTDPVSAISFGMALMFGTAGLPHILMRFFTVPSAKEARKSVFVATGFIGYFYLLTFIIGFSAITLLAQHPEFFKTAVDGHFNLTRDLLGGSNMVAVKLAQAVGGNLFYGFIAAVTFATILAVVAGLTLSGATTVSHDLYACWLARGKGSEAQEMRISRISTLALSIVAIGLGILFEHVNVAFLVGLVAAVAASANFPVLVSSIFWRGMTTRGAVVGGGLGLVCAVLLTLFSKSVWVDVLHQAHAPVSLDNPALISVPLAFAGIWLFSILDRGARAQREREAFALQEFYSQTGILALKAAEH